MSGKEQEFWNACDMGDLALVRSLYNQADVNWRNQEWLCRTGLHAACRDDNKDVVEYLLTHPHIDVNRGDQYEQTPLLIACFNGEDEIVEILVGDHRVDVNKRSETGSTPIWNACFQGKEKAAKILLASGRDVDATRRTNEDTWLYPNTTAAEIAREKGYPQLAELIEDYERNPKEVAQRLRQELGQVEAFRNSKK